MKEVNLQLTPRELKNLFNESIENRKRKQMLQQIEGWVFEAKLNDNDDYYLDESKLSGAEIKRCLIKLFQEQEFEILG